MFKRFIFLRGYLLVSLLFVTLFALSACGKVPDPPASAFEPEPPKGPTVNVTVYYPIIGSQGGYVVAEPTVLAKTKNVPKSAIERLITGRPSTEGFHGTYIPAFNPKTKVRNVKIKNGVATVDFNRTFLDGKVIDDRQEKLAIAGIVNTLSEFPNVSKVRITVEGKASGKVGGKDVEAFWGQGTLKAQPFSVSAKKTKKME